MDGKHLSRDDIYNSIMAGMIKDAWEYDYGSMRYYHEYVACDMFVSCQCGNDSIKIECEIYDGIAHWGVLHRGQVFQWEDSDPRTVSVVMAVEDFVGQWVDCEPWWRTWGGKRDG